MNLFPQYKIQKSKIPLDSDYWVCIRKLLFNYCIIIFPISFLNYPALTFLGVQTSLESLPSLSLALFHLLLFMFIEDFLHYWLHRLLHVPYLYKYIHKMHHHHKYPFGISAAYAHPVEVLLLAIPTYFGPVVFAPHLSTVYLWILFREIDSVDTHCGYEFPWHPSNLIPVFWGASKAHDYHHEAFTCNFASRFTYLDKIFGTYGERDNKNK
eukprot:TRINITY_DN1266_c0_g1_i5.p1 TRINITY_DN1266_c0_g1~~TRINITY_DN1266_c0_g1_i5.p1  ORF type:complete len:211 (-),score=7.74 TRINITY_DN1266_c0_g1_i5:136-768(-)